LFTVFPNPVTDFLYFTPKPGASIDEITLSDAFGKEILKITYEGTKIDLTHLDHGIYTLTVRNHKSSTHKKFIKS
jgi:hypothetical protein